MTRACPCGETFTASVDLAAVDGDIVRVDDGTVTVNGVPSDVWALLAHQSTTGHEPKGATTCRGRKTLDETR